jgi:hypothetical protein
MYPILSLTNYLAEYSNDEKWVAFIVVSGSPAIPSTLFGLFRDGFSFPPM